MAYIYKITNDINDKIYVGKTEYSIEKRFKEHCQDSKRKRCEKRPLYNAMNKYGIEHFHIELIEETNEPEEREIYWIQHYGSFKYGYNATMGGDGKHYKDYDLVVALFKEGKTINEIAKILNYDTKTCRIALERASINAKERQSRGREVLYHSVIQLDKNTEEVLAIYPSVAAAQNALKKQNSGHIAAACRGKRKTAYGYKWKYGE